jgi:hypothetical protein
MGVSTGTGRCGSAVSSRSTFCFRASGTKGTSDLTWCVNDGACERVRAISESMPPEQVQALLMIAGNEEVGDF